MSILDRLRPGAEDDSHEQLAPDDPAPRGESRDSGFIVSVFGGSNWISASSTSNTTSTDTDDELETVRSSPPDNLEKNHRKYFKETEFPRAALKIFSLTTTEPGYHIGASKGEETDEEMQEALREWAAQCAIDACEPGQDLSVLLKQAPILRRSKGVAFIEKAGTNDDPNTLAALVYHKPETFVQYKQANKSLLVQPDDPVGEDHPRTPSGDAAAYVQYDDSLSSYDDDSIAFSADDIVKLTYDADNGDAWGSSLWEACGDRIDALYTKLEDRDSSIRTVGHAHRIYSSENWSQEEAQNYAEAHKEGEVSAGPNVGDHSNDPDGYADSWPGRVDFVSDAVEVNTATGDVADIDDAVKDDIEAIFSVLPVAKCKVAYSQDVNQYSIDVLDALDARLVDEERQYLKRKFKPIIEEKADELAGGEYDGSITFRVEPSEPDNPLAREDFPADNLDSFTSSLKELYQAGVEPELIDSILSNIGMDREDIEDEFGGRYEVDELEEGDDQVQEQFEQQQDEAVADGGTEQ